MEKCKKRNTEHCTKSKFCAIRDRSKNKEPLSESYLQVIATTSLSGLYSYLLAIVLTNIVTLLLYYCNNVSLVPDIYF